MKNKRILQYLGIMLFGVLAFFFGFYCGTDDYKSDLIAVKHIDGKYGKAFYGVEVFGKDGKSLLAVEYTQVTLITPKN